MKLTVMLWTCNHEQSRSWYKYGNRCRTKHQNVNCFRDHGSKYFWNVNQSIIHRRVKVKSNYVPKVVSIRVNFNKMRVADDTFEH